MEENKKSETEDAQNLHPGKLGIGKIIFVGCLALLLLFFLFFERSSKLICNTCNSSKLEPKAILVCLQTAKVPFKEIRFPYSIVKRTHCRCKDCGAIAWVNMKDVEKKLSFSNNWGGGSDLSCPFCDGIMKTGGCAHGDCVMIWDYKCCICKRKLSLIHCYDQPISWAESFFKDVD